MLNRYDQLSEFKERIRAAIRKDPRRIRTIKVARRSCVFMPGAPDATAYYIRQGQVKLVLYTPEGKECVVGIRSAGDIFGETCLSAQAKTCQTAVALQDSILDCIPFRSLLGIMNEEALLDGLVRYLADCIAYQQEFIASLLSVNSEQRLAKVLLQLGTVIDVGGSYRVPKILLKDLAAMVGTTRSRVGYFLKHFRAQGLIQINEDHSLTIEAKKLQDFVENSRSSEDSVSRRNRNQWRPDSSASLLPIEAAQTRGEGI